MLSTTHRVGFGAATMNRSAPRPFMALKLELLALVSLRRPIHGGVSRDREVRGCSPRSVTQSRRPGVWSHGGAGAAYVSHPDRRRSGRQEALSGSTHCV